MNTHICNYKAEVVRYFEILEPFCFSFLERQLMNVSMVGFDLNIMQCIYMKIVHCKYSDFRNTLYILWKFWGPKSVILKPLI